MSRDYSPKHFLRKTPNALLKQYFEKNKVLKELNLESLSETGIDPILDGLEQLPDSVKTKIEQEFRQINEMACQAGVRVLLEEAEFPLHNLELGKTFEKMGGHYERAFWMFLNHPDIFDIAANFASMDRVSSWRRCNAGTGLVPKITENDKNKLAAGISDFYKKQGRGYHCHVDNYLRQKPERHCYFVYPEDYATKDIEYDKEGKLVQRTRKPVFEMVFVYRPETGILETNAKGKKADVEKLQEIFCNVILGSDNPPDKKTSHFNLSSLKNKDFALIADPQDGVEHIAIKMLRLDLPGIENRRITFEAKPSNGQQTIHKLIEKALNKENIPLDSVLVTKAKLQFKFRPVNGKRGKTLTFEMSTPDRCTLKDDPLDQIAKKCIENWRLVSG